jgi:biotin operon repressor
VGQTDGVEEYRRAVERLASLEPRVAAQESLEEVTEAVMHLRLAVARVFRGQRPRKAQGHGASKSILDHMLANIGEWVYGDELAAVSGIREWARRVRELRVEAGYEIEESNGRYRLTRRDPDLMRRDRWRFVTGLRDSGGTPEERVRKLFEHLVRQIVTIDEVDRVARSRAGTRLVRQLRTQDRWPIESEADSLTLQSGEYRLVFRRDSYHCWDCHQSEETAATSPHDPFYLVVRHLDALPAKLSGLPAQTLSENSRLATSCIRCVIKRHPQNS